MRLVTHVQVVLHIYANYVNSYTHHKLNYHIYILHYYKTELFTVGFMNIH